MRLAAQKAARSLGLTALQPLLAVLAAAAACATRAASQRTPGASVGLQARTNSKGHGWFPECMHRHIHAWLHRRAMDTQGALHRCPCAHASQGRVACAVLHPCMLHPPGAGWVDTDVLAFALSRSRGGAAPAQMTSHIRQHWRSGQHCCAAMTAATTVYSTARMRSVSGSTQCAQLQDPPSYKLAVAQQCCINDICMAGPPGLWPTGRLTRAVHFSSVMPKMTRFRGPTNVSCACLQLLYHCLPACAPTHLQRPTRLTMPATTSTMLYMFIYSTLQSR